MMMMRTGCLIIIVMIFLFCFDPPYSAAATRKGSESLVSNNRSRVIVVDLDVNGRKAIEIANFAVSEHNKGFNTRYLELSKILSCKKIYKRFDRAYFYSLQLLAYDGFYTKMYLARVAYVASFFKSSYYLLRFELIPNPHQQ
ncbi:hypothetical protein PIB30_099486 [Stylosanthes scabra]|uniref:Cystatin domain-containing protein n=1 Tax=Stylosanthes scabra TaxID=79078 RepID=A0ABU6WYL0_9FABA|nr:hypothetical protein [Stylosanthes scabra]